MDQIASHPRSTFSIDPATSVVYLGEVPPSHSPRVLGSVGIALFKILNGHPGSKLNVEDILDGLRKTGHQLTGSQLRKEIQILRDALKTASVRYNKGYKGIAFIRGNLTDGWYMFDPSDGSDLSRGQIVRAS